MKKKKPWAVIGLITWGALILILGFFLYITIDSRQGIQDTQAKINQVELDRVATVTQWAMVLDKVDQKQVALALNYVGNGDFTKGHSELLKLDNSELPARDLYIIGQAKQDYTKQTAKLNGLVKEQNTCLNAYNWATKKGISGWFYQKVLRKTPYPFEQFSMKKENLHVVGKY